MAKILIADKAEFLRERLINMLLNDGHEIFEAGNGVQAVTIYKETFPDVVLMDVNMPEMDGVEALKEMIEINPDAHVIVLAALGQEAIALEAVRSGAKDVILKPFEECRVMNSIAKVLL